MNKALQIAYLAMVEQPERLPANTQAAPNDTHHVLTPNGQDAARVPASATGLQATR
jgi:hypothetical protein